MPGKNFKCKRCGYCCTLRVIVSWLDILRILKAGYKPREYVIRDINNKKCIKMIKRDCFFLKRNKNKTECKIYKYRPKICRNHPSYNDKESCVKFNPAVRNSFI